MHVAAPLGAPIAELDPGSPSNEDLERAIVAAMLDGRGAGVPQEDFCPLRALEVKP
jgi:hypothetical protein